MTSATPHFHDDTVTLLLGDAREQAASLEPRSVQAVVTSPPYFSLRDYGVAGQLGAESSPAEFIANLVSVFDAIRPALADDGTLWVNLGDSYVAARGQGNAGGNLEGGPRPSFRGKRESVATTREGIRYDRPNKSMLGIPWRFAFAMQDAGWILRNDIIWAKPNGMPESVRDRFSTKHEHIFLFTKNPRYYFDLDAVRIDLLRPDAPAGEWVFGGKNKVQGSNPVMRRRGTTYTPPEDGKRNPGDVWSVSTKPFTGAHFATFPPELPERCILASTRPDDTVLDPFSGSGTTGMVATKHGRRYIGIDLNPEYHDLALKTRLAQGVLA